MNHVDDDVSMYKTKNISNNKNFPQTATEATTVDANATTSTTTERYRISRKEFGYILGRNYRGLNKLFHIELNEALNVMRKQKKNVFNIFFL